MRNRYIEKFDSIIKIKIEGKNINNYIKRLLTRKINIIRLIPISYKEVHLIIKYQEYQKIIKYKTTYKISIIDTYGTIKIKKNLKKNTILILAIILGLFLIITLSNLIFSIDIIHQDKEIRILLKQELELNGIKKYHFKKSIEAENLGIRLIHIYEYEWLDLNQRLKIQSLLKTALNVIPTKIYARNCEVKLITNAQAKIFNNLNHLQGHRNAQVTYGLFYHGNLVQLMSFSRTRYNKNLVGDNTWEIIRGCPGSNNIVVGGVSKLFKYFIKKHNPDSIFSYCDFNKFNGIGYTKLGMKFIGYTAPDMKWILPGGIIQNRSPHKHTKLKETAIAKIFGAGSKKYLWEKN